MTVADQQGEGWQTMLFVPADQPSMLRKAQRRGAAALVVDLEDAIAQDRKDAAREALLAELTDGTLSGSARVYVRINAPAHGGLTDADALSQAPIAGLVVPKAARPDDLLQVQAALGRRSLPLIPQVESAAGVLRLPQLLAAEIEFAAVAFGGEDFALDLGVARSPQSLELLFPRAWVALCARAAELPAIDTVYTDILNDQGLRREARIAASLGFSGKLVIHPNQIPTVAAVFSPSESQLAWARKVLEAAEEAAADGSGVATVDDAMVDAPIVAQAARILARADAGKP